MPPITLENNYFKFECNPDNGVFSLYSKRIGLPSIQNSSLKIQIIKEGVKHNLITNTWHPYQLMKTISNSIHGKLHQLEFSVFIEELNQIIRLTFALSEDNPFLLWNVVLENQSSTPIYINFLEMLNIDETITSAESRIIRGNGTAKANLSFHSNGWQSWSHSATYRDDQAQKHTRLRHFQDVMVQNPGTPVFRQVGKFSGDFFGVLADRNLRNALLFGFLSQKKQFGSIEVNLAQKTKVRVWANGDRTTILPGSSIMTDWAIIYPFYFDQPDPLALFYNSVARENDIQLTKKIPAGWCSWYHFYQNITEDKIDRNLKTIIDQKENLPFDLVQIDDGYQKEIGDWFSFRKGFLNGVSMLSKNIKESGYTPGLWMAPFILHPNSDFALDHPEMILRKPGGRPVNAGFVWNVFTQALDLTAPGAIEHVIKMIETATKDWGYPYLKLDFLYAGALKGNRFDNTLTRAQILRKAMEVIRKTAGEDTFILGCGAPLGSVLGLVDANRIGADVSGDWTPKYFGLSGIFKKEPHMPSARNSIQNILTRAEQHNRWWINDPDCLLVRPEINLSIHEIRSLASIIALTGGSLLVSDDLPNLPADRRKIIEVLLPLIGKRANVMDWLDTEMPHNIRLDLKNGCGDWNILGRFNWKDHPREIFLSFPDFCLPQLGYWAYSFWENKVRMVNPGEPINLGTLSPHGVSLIAIRPIKEGNFYLGSNLHISMGLEVNQIKDTQDEFVVDFQLPRIAEGDVYLHLLKTPQSATLNNEKIPFEEVNTNVYKFSVAFNQFAQLKIEL